MPWQNFKIPTSPQNFLDETFAAPANRVCGFKILREQFSCHSDDIFCRYKFHKRNSIRSQANLIRPRFEINFINEIFAKVKRLYIAKLSRRHDSTRASKALLYKIATRCDFKIGDGLFRKIPTSRNLKTSRSAIL